MSKKGNSYSNLATIGARNRAKQEREIDDFYATPPHALELLLQKEPISRRVWECACGGGHLSKVLEAHGCEVRSTDLIDRGYGIGGVDFLAQTELWDGDILTNPPYTRAREFVEKALELVENGNKVIMLLKIQFLESKERKILFQKYPPPLNLCQHKPLEVR